MADWRLRPASPDDLGVARGMLAAAGLPTEDLSSESLAIVAEAAGDIAGIIGLERFTGRGLLRSLVVSDRFRGRGLGNTLVAALEEHALEMGVTELWLLTIDADRWFAGHAYEVIERGDAPEDIRNTREFSSLCPGDAVLMRKELSR
jgi:amino-acid N-acetyltransferase